MILCNAHLLCRRVLNESFVPHGRTVVEHYTRNAGLIAFERLWREHFLRNMRPKHLPHMWSVDHHHDELRKLAEALQKHTPVTPVTPPSDNTINHTVPPTVT